MPAAVPLVGVAAGFGAASALGLATGTLAFAVVSGVVSTAVNQLGSRALAKKPKGPEFTPQGRTIMVRSPIETHKLIYGQDRVAGPVINVVTTNNGQAPASAARANKMLYMVIPLAGHEVSAIDDVYLNDRYVEIDGATQVITAPYRAPSTAVFARIGKNLGTEDQAADNFLVSEIPNWTTEHRGKGIAYVWARFEYSEDIFPLGIPNVSALVKGKELYDPRTATTAWSNNPALCVRDYLINECDVAESRIPDSYVIAAANACDEMVATKVKDAQVASIDTSADTLSLRVAKLPYQVGDRVTVFTDGTQPGGITALTNYFVIPVTNVGATECVIKLAASYADALAGTAVDITSAGTGDIVVRRNAAPRYRCNGSIDTGVSRRENLTALLSSMAGEVIRSGNEVRIYAGAYDAAVGTLTDDMLAGDMVIRARTPRSELVNTVRGTYIDPLKNWQPTDFPPVKNTTYIAQDNGNAYTKDLELPFTNDPEAAQRIGKLLMEKSRQGIVVEETLNHSALKYSTWDVVGITQDHVGWSDKPFRIRQLKISDLPAGTISMVLQEESSASYDWSSDEAADLDAAPDTNLPSPFDVETPGTPAIVETLYSTTDGSGVKAKATVTWSESANAFLREYQLEYKLASASEYSLAGRTPNTMLEIFDIAPGVYDFRVKAINTLGVSSAYTDPAVKELYGLTAAPADVTGFGMEPQDNRGIFRWDQATDLDVKVGGWVRIRYTPLTSGANWNAAIDVGNALPGIATSAELPLLDGTYLIKFVDSTGHASNSAASITTTVTRLLELNVVETVTEDPGFAGAKSGVVYDEALEGIKLTGDTDWDDYSGDIDDWPIIDSLGGVTSAGTYDFDGSVDLGAVYKSRLTASIEAYGYDTGDTIDARLDDIDTWTSFGGEGLSDFTSSFFVDASQVTITADAAIAPDGTMTASSVTEEAVSGSHKFFADESPKRINIDANYTIEVYVKPVGDRNLQLSVQWGGDEGDFLFDLTDGSVNSTSVSSFLTVDDYGITPAGNGWYRVWVTSRSNLGINDELEDPEISILDDAFDFAYDGDGSSGLLFWGYDSYPGGLKPIPAIDDVNAALYVRQTDDDPSGSPAWSSWQRFFVGDYTARAFEFQLRMTSENSTHNMLVSGLSVTVDMPERVESQSNLSSGAGTYNATFPAAFKAVPAISVTPKNMATGDYYEITNESATGFNIVFRNSGGTAVSRNFDYYAKGYGKIIT